MSANINTLATPLVDQVNNSFVQAQLWGKNVGVCIVGSNLARDLDAVGGSALIDLRTRHDGVDVRKRG